MATAGKSTQPKKQVTAAPPSVKISLQALFTLASASQQRWTPTQSISGATVTIRGTTVSAVSNANGEVSLPVSTLAGKGRVLEITAATNQASNGPAGPITSTANFATEPRFRLRPFEVTVDCLASGFDITVAPKISYTAVPDVPAHALTVKFEQQLLRLDWKPDWIKSANRNVIATKVNQFLVLHQTSASESIGPHINTFTNPQSGVGIHYLVDVDGHVVKLVHEGDGVNHTGASFWLGTRGLNGKSIGIEIVHDDSGGVHAFPAAQMTAVVRLVREIRAAFPLITRQHVVGHSDLEVVGVNDATIGTRRQNDPGEAFEWEQLEAAAMARQQLLGPNPAIVYGLTAGQSLTPRSPPSPHISAVQTDLSAIGYSVANNGTNISGVYDLALERAVARFQMRYLSGGRRTLRPPTFRLGELDYVTATTIKSVVADNGP